MRWTYDTRPDGSVAEFHGDPIIADEFVIAGSDDRREDGIGHVYAFERGSGKLRWRYRASRGVIAEIVHLGSSVYAMSLKDELFCLDLDSGP